MCYIVGMARVYVLASMLLACVLSSCYTNVNQLWFKGKREYEVCWFDYCADKKGAVRSLSPRLYRSGDEWYIAARYSKYRDRYPDSCVQWVGLDYEERHGIAPNLQAPIYYHRITPRMAEQLQRRNVNSLNCFEEKLLRKDIASAGGEWVPRLPAGARAVRAEGLSSNSSLLLVNETNHASWLAYPASWLTFLCVDVPATTISFALTPVYFILNAPQGEEGECYNDYVEYGSSWWSDDSDDDSPAPARRHGSRRLPPGPPAHSSAPGKPHAPSPGKRPSGGRDKPSHGGGSSHHHGSHGGGSHGGGHHSSASHGGGHHHHSSSSPPSRHHGRSDGDRKRDDSSSKDHSSSSKKRR